MGLETGIFLSDLNEVWPLSSDGLTDADDHLRLLKKTIKNTFVGANGNGFEKAILSTEDEINFLQGANSNLQSQIDSLSSTISLGSLLVGGIVMYNGTFAGIPANYNLCDGSNGTPNLTDVFIYGTNTEAQVGDTGGFKDATLVSHNHTANHAHTGSTGQAGAENNTFDRVNDASTGGEEGIPVDINILNTVKESGLIDADTNHAHSVTIDNANVTTSTSGTSATDKNLPPYYKLAYVRRMS